MLFEMFFFSFSLYVADTLRVRCYARELSSPEHNAEYVIQCCIDTLRRFAMLPLAPALIILMLRF